MKYFAKTAETTENGISIDKSNSNNYNKVMNI